MAFSGKRVLTSTEKRLMNEFITGTSGKGLSNTLLKADTWKEMKKDSPICAATVELPVAGKEQQVCFAINDNECQLTLWGKPDTKTYPKDSMEEYIQKTQYDELGGQVVTVTTTANTTTLLIRATDEESTDKLLLFFWVILRLL